MEEEEEGRGKGTVRGTVHLVIVPQHLVTVTVSKFTYRTFPKYI